MKAKKGVIGNEVCGQLRLTSFQNELKDLLIKYDATLEVADLEQPYYEFNSTETVIQLTIGETFDDDGNLIERHRADLGAFISGSREESTL